MEILSSILIQLIFNGTAAAGWFLLIRRLDKARRVKGREQRLHRFLFAGMLSAPLALGLEYGVSYVITPLFTGNMPLNYFIDQFFVAGVTEELSKFFLFFIMTRRLNSIIEPRDGVLQACSIALGFATIENILYGMNYGVETSLYRSLMCTSGHIIYSFLWSAAYSLVMFTTTRGKRKGNTFPMLMGIVPAALLHGLYNFVIDIGHGGFAIVVNSIGLVIAVVIYREVLKHSPYTPHTKKNYEEGFPLVLQALTNHPEDFELNYRAGRHCLYTQDFAAAAGYFSVCYKTRPGHAKTCLYYTIALTGIRQYYQAKMVFYRRFVTINDNDTGKLWREIRRLHLSCSLMNDLGVIFTCIESLRDISILNVQKMV